MAATLLRASRAPAIGAVLVEASPVPAIGAFA